MADRDGGFVRRALWRNPVLYVCALLYAALRLAQWQWPHAVPDLVQHYLADVLALPLVLSVVLLLQQFVVLQQPHYRLSGVQVVFAVLYFVLVFELVLPWFHWRYTADWWDVAAYASGGALYWFLLNPKK